MEIIIYKRINRKSSSYPYSAITRFPQQILLHFLRPPPSRSLKLKNALIYQSFALAFSVCTSSLSRCKSSPFAPSLRTSRSAPQIFFSKARFTRLKALLFSLTSSSKSLRIRSRLCNKFFYCYVSYGSRPSKYFFPTFDTAQARRVYHSLAYSYPSSPFLLMVFKLQTHQFEKTRYPIVASIRRVKFLQGLKKPSKFYRQRS